MLAKSSSDRYGTVAKIIHWVSALMILVLLASGIRADGTEDPLSKMAILRVHAPLGAAIFILTLARIGWWWFADTKPTSVPMPRWQDRISRAVHVLFYVVIIGLGASGVGMMILSGAGPIIFQGAAETLPDFWDYPPRAPHGIGAKVMIALLVMHLGGALYHQFVKKDGLINRMWFGGKA